MAKTFADCLDNVIFVKAKFQFVGSSDDELSFNNGDVIVVTKEDDGGWWEGTLDGKIGWFPNNYVYSISRDPEPVPDQLPLSDISEENSQYHSLVVENIIHTQKGHLDDLKKFQETFLEPLKNSDILTKSDRDTLAGNYKDIVDFHILLNNQLEKESHKPIPEQRFGMCYLTLTNQIRELYLQYCSNHPHAAYLISQYGDELSTYMESMGAQSPGSMTLTLMLSKPFLHVEKYGNQIKELERHILEDHIDNLDMKKATQVLQIIALSSKEVRKKKEKEIQMLTSEIEGWKGEPVCNLGSLVYMGQVFVEVGDTSRKERYFCLFPKDILVLSVSPLLVGYCFEGKHPISVVTAKNIEDSDTFFNGFHLTVLDKLWKVMTSSPREKDVWMDALKKVLGNRCDLTKEKINVGLTPPISASNDLNKRSDVKSMSFIDANLDTTDFVRSHSVGPGGQYKKRNGSARSTGSSPVHAYDEKLTTVSTIPVVHGPSRQPVRKEWSFTRLRPTPPYQEKSSDSHIETKKHATFSKKNSKGSIGKDELNGFVSKASSYHTGQDRNEKQILEEDMMILSVIEAYCFSNRTQIDPESPENPYLPPDVPPHFSFKPITPARITTLGKQKTIKKFNKKKPREGDNSEMFELKQQVQNLHKQTLYLRENLEEERKSRETFEKFLKKALNRISPDINWNEDGALHKTTPL